MLLKFAIKDFLDDRKFNNCSPQTITSYMYTLNQFYDYCIKSDVVRVEDVTGSPVKFYLTMCQDQLKNNPTTINHKIIDLRAFFNYCIRESILNEKRNPCERIIKLKTDTKIAAFTDEQITQMINYYRRLRGRDKTYYAVRDYVIILTLLGTGVRIGELVSIRWTDVDLTSDKVVVFGKKRQQRTIPIVDRLKREMLEWKVFQEQYFKGKQVEYVFNNTYGSKMTVASVQNVFKRLKVIMNFKNVRLSAHTFRHTFAKNWIMANGDQFSLQRIMGHNSIDMVNRDVSLFGSAIKEQNDKFSPLNTMKI